MHGIPSHLYFLIEKHIFVTGLSRDNSLRSHTKTVGRPNQRTDDIDSAFNHHSNDTGHSRKEADVVTASASSNDSDTAVSSPESDGC